MIDDALPQIRSASEVPNANDDETQQSDSSAASAPSRIEGNVLDTDEEDEASDDSDDEAMDPSALEDVLERAEEEPYYDESKIRSFDPPTRLHLANMMLQVSNIPYISKKRRVCDSTFGKLDRTSSSRNI